jgi:hypothetical protein
MKILFALLIPFLLRSFVSGQTVPDVFAAGATLSTLSAVVAAFVSWTLFSRLVTL